MHDGCTGQTGDGQMVVNKVRMMGFAGNPLPFPLNLDCHGCGESMKMATFEFACPGGLTAEHTLRLPWSSASMVCSRYSTSRWKFSAAAGAPAPPRNISLR